MSFNEWLGIIGSISSIIALIFYFLDKAEFISLKIPGVLLVGLIFLTISLLIININNKKGVNEYIDKNNETEKVDDDFTSEHSDNNGSNVEILGKHTADEKINNEIEKVNGDFTVEHLDSSRSNIETLEKYPTNNYNNDKNLINSTLTQESNYVGIKFENIEREYFYIVSNDTGIRVSVKYLQPVESDSRVDLKQLQTQISKDVFLNDHIENNILLTIERNGKNFIEENKIYSESKFHLEWEINVVYNDDYILSLKQGGEGYYGGAHGLPIDDYFNYDLLTGKRITYDDIFHHRGEKGLAKVIANKLKILSGGDINSDLVDLGFFSNDIEVSKRIYITNTEVCFVYSPYEINCYADGDVCACIDIKDLTMFFNPTCPLRRFIK